MTQESVDQLLLSPSKEEEHDVFASKGIGVIANIASCQTDLIEPCVRDDSFSPLMSQNEHHFVYTFQTQPLEVDIHSGTSGMQNPSENVPVSFSEDGESPLGRIHVTKTQGIAEMWPKNRFLDDVQSTLVGSVINLDPVCPLSPLKNVHLQQSFCLQQDKNSSSAQAAADEDHRHVHRNPYSLERGVQRFSQDVHAVGKAKETSAIIALEPSISTSLIAGPISHGFDRARKRKAIGISKTGRSSSENSHENHQSKHNNVENAAGVRPSLIGDASVESVFMAPNSCTSGITPHIALCPIGEDTVNRSRSGSGTRDTKGSCGLNISESNLPANSCLDELGDDKGTVTYDGSVRACSGFSTAGKGRTIVILEESLTKASKVLGDLTSKELYGSDLHSIPCCDTGDRCSEDPQLNITHADIGFHTAGSHSKVTVSAESIVNATKVLNLIDCPHYILTRNGGEREVESRISMSDGTTSTDEVNLESAKYSCISFATAGKGVKISVTDQSLTNAMKLLTDLPISTSVDSASPSNAKELSGDKDNETLTIDGTLTYRTTEHSDMRSVCLEGSRITGIGFITAGSGATIATSDESIEKATTLLQSVTTSGGNDSNCIVDCGQHGLTSARLIDVRSSSEGDDPERLTRTTAVTASQAQVRSHGECAAKVSALETSSGRHNYYDEFGAASTHDKAVLSYLQRDDAPGSRPPGTRELAGIARGVQVISRSNRVARWNNSFQVCRAFGVHKTTIHVNSTSAPRLRFNRDTWLPSHFLGHQISNDSVGGANDIRNALVKSGLDTKNLSDRWLTNHSRWIIWKLACIERRFPREASGKHLTFGKVVHEMKTRYDREIRCGMRSSIRKVLNKDASSASTMILCVSMIHPRETMRGLSNARANEGIRPEQRIIELTDGWYGVKAVTDSLLNEKIENNIIRVGTKIVVCNAVLRGAGDGMDPLDESYDSTTAGSPVYFVLSSNATRLAAWNSRLGFAKPTTKLMASHGGLRCRRIQDIVVGGGLVPCIDLLVCRVYPKLYLERDGHHNGGGRLSSVLSESEEQAKCADLEQKRTKAIERAIESVQMKCSTDTDCEASPVFRIDARSDNMLENRACEDNWVSQRESFISNRVQMEVKANLLDDSWYMSRESSPFLTLYVKSVCDKTCEGALLTMWNTTEGQEAILKEGTFMSFQNLAVKSCRRDGLVQLTGRDSTPMHEIQYDSETKGLMGFKNRSLVPLFRLHLTSRKLSVGIAMPFPQQHLDIAGLIIKVVQYSMHHLKVYLTDDSGLVTRIDRYGSVEGSKAFKSMLENGRSMPFPIAFRDVRAMPFDLIENCTVASFTPISSVTCKAAAQGLRRLGWLETLASAAIEAGTSIHAMTSQLSVPIVVAIGRIVGCEEDSGASSAFIIIHVDCGSLMLHKWALPSFLVDDALDLIGRGRKQISLSPHISNKSENTMGLHSALTTCAPLLRFVLQMNKAAPEVRQLSIAEQSAMTALHARVQQNRMTHSGSSKVKLGDSAND